ncbi:hypothetical protein V8F33_002184 [Rhypophila sp. PSN 637]
MDQDYSNGGDTNGNKHDRPVIVDGRSRPPSYWAAHRAGRPASEAGSATMLQGQGNQVALPDIPSNRQPATSSGSRASVTDCPFLWQLPSTPQRRIPYEQTLNRDLGIAPSQSSLLPAARTGTPAAAAAAAATCSNHQPRAHHRAPPSHPHAATAFSIDVIWDAVPAMDLTHRWLAQQNGQGNEEAVALSTTSDHPRAPPSHPPSYHKRQVQAAGLAKFNVKTGTKTKAKANKTSLTKRKETKATQKTKTTSY